MTTFKILRRTIKGGHERLFEDHLAADAFAISGTTATFYRGDVTKPETFTIPFAAVTGVELIGPKDIE
jgi:hypothetical protein